MLAVNYTTLRNQLKYYCDKAAEEQETIVITRKGDNNVVLVGLERYNALTKAAHLTGGKQPPEEEGALGDAPAEPDPLPQREGASEEGDVEKAMRIAYKYAVEVKQVLPVEKAVLFGSYAKGRATKASDIDICFFLRDFGGRPMAEVMLRLLELSGGYKGVMLDPVVFKMAEIERGNPLVREILADGIEL